MVTPEMRLGWHRRMVGRRWTYPAQARGQPSGPQQVQTLIVRLATENPRWGDQRIRGELLGLGGQVSASSIAKVLRANGLPRGATLASWAPADPAVPQLHWSQRGQGVECTTTRVRRTTTGRIRRFLGQAVTDGLLVWRGRGLREAPFALVVDPGLRPRFFSVFPTPANFRSR
jgi:hypothetical protein